MREILPWKGVLEDSDKGYEEKGAVGVLSTAGKLKVFGRQRADQRVSNFGHWPRDNSSIMLGGLFGCKGFKE